MPSLAVWVFILLPAMGVLRLRLDANESKSVVNIWKCEFG